MGNYFWKWEWKRHLLRWCCATKLMTSGHLCSTRFYYWHIVVCLFVCFPEYAQLHTAKRVRASSLSLQIGFFYMLIFMLFPSVPILMPQEPINICPPNLTYLSRMAYAIHKMPNQLFNAHELLGNIFSLIKKIYILKSQFSAISLFCKVLCEI